MGFHKRVRCIGDDTAVARDPVDSELGWRYLIMYEARCLSEMFPNLLPIHIICVTVQEDRTFSRRSRCGADTHWRSAGGNVGRRQRRKRRRQCFERSLQDRCGRWLGRTVELPNHATQGDEKAKCNDVNWLHSPDPVSNVLTVVPTPSGKRCRERQ